VGELLDAIRSLHLPEGRRAHDQSGSPDSFRRYTLGQAAPSGSYHSFSGWLADMLSWGRYTEIDKDGE
jgi:hypothetical protein